ncbi:DUF1427 family protein [Roseomonas sp. F4]
MKLYLLSLGTGLPVGLIYGLLQVRSPAPPIVALLGLLGILLGEQVVPVMRRILTSHPNAVSARRSDCVRHIFGHLPGHGSAGREAG